MIDTPQVRQVSWLHSVKKVLPPSSLKLKHLFLINERLHDSLSMCYIASIPLPECVCVCAFVGYVGILYIAMIKNKNYVVHMHAM